MRVCYLTHDMEPKAGWGRYASELVSGIRAAGHEAVVLKEKDDGFEGFPVLKRGFGILKSVRAAKSHLANCDIIHALDIYPYGIIAWLANMSLGKKLVITVQGTYSIAPLYNWKTAWFAKQAYKAADAVVAISSFTKKELLKKVDRQNIVVINHGVDLKKFLKPHIESPEQFILSVGALKYRKGYHISIPAFALIKRKFTQLRYIIVGYPYKPNYFKYIKGLAREYGVERDVEFLSNISDDELGKLYQTARLFVLTSVNDNHHFEGFGLVFLEAAAAGLPVVGTLDNGIEDAVKAGGNGLLVPQGDIEATADAIVEILGDDDKWQKMSQESVEWAKTHDLDGVVGQYLKVYSALID